MCGGGSSVQNVAQRLLKEVWVGGEVCMEAALHTCSTPHIIRGLLYGAEANQGGVCGREAAFHSCQGWGLPPPVRPISVEALRGMLCGAAA